MKGLLTDLYLVKVGLIDERIGIPQSPYIENIRWGKEIPALGEDKYNVIDGQLTRNPYFSIEVAGNSLIQLKTKAEEKLTTLSKKGVKFNNPVLVLENDEDGARVLILSNPSPMTEEELMATVSLEVR